MFLLKTMVNDELLLIDYILFVVFDSFPCLFFWNVLNDALDANLIYSGKIQCLSYRLLDNYELLLIYYVIAILNLISFL